MPQTISDRQPVTHNNGWTNSANAIDAGLNDTTAATATRALTDLNDSATAALILTDFNVLAEDGGTIPAGATIVDVAISFRVRTTNGDGTLNTEVKARVVTRVRRAGASLSELSLAPANGANAVAGPTTIIHNFDGTPAVPQTGLTRADFANAADFDLWITGVKTAGVSGSVATVAVFWATVTIQWLKDELTQGVVTVGLDLRGRQQVDAQGRGLQRLDQGEDARARSSVEADRRWAIVAQGEDLLYRGVVEADRRWAVVAQGEELGVARSLIDVLRFAAVIEGPDLRSDLDVDALVRGAAAEGSDARGGLDVDASAFAVVAEGAVLQGDLDVEVAARGVWIEGQDLRSGQAFDLRTAALIVEGEDLHGDAVAFTFSFAGVTRDQAGDVLPGCTVWLFRTSDRTLIGETVSDGSGAYQFNLTSEPIEFFARAHIDEAERLFGTTDRNLTVDALQFYP